MPASIPTQIALATGAGLISGVVFASSATGDAVLRVILFFLVALPLYLAGLGLGQAAGLIAALTATLFVLGLGGGAAGLFFGASVALPAASASRQALLSQGDGDDRVWYPAGRIVASLALLGGGAAAIGMLMIGADMTALTQTMRTALEEVFKNNFSQLPGAQKLTPEQLDELAARMIRVLPWVLGATITFVSVINLWLAGRVTLAAGGLVRPWPEISQFELPPPIVIALGCALAGVFAGGTLGLISAAFSGALVLAFALLGLATAHALTNGKPWRGFALAPLYAALAMQTGAVLVLLAILGLAETVFRYRGTRDGGPINS